MRAFVRLWLGQTASGVGSQMTAFALALWMFEQTGQVSTLALVALAGAIPQILLLLGAGVLVDRFNRQRLMIVCDTGAGVVTLVWLLLFATGALQFWHLYAGAALLTAFNGLQMLTYDVVATTMVERSQYIRVAGMVTLSGYATDLLSPALAAALYTSVGVLGVMLVDLTTLAFAITMTAASTIPQPTPVPRQPGSLLRRTLGDLALGFHTLWCHRALRTLVLINMLFFLSHDFVNTLYGPMMLARTNNDAGVIALWSLSMGLGGGLMSLVVSARGGRGSTRVYALATIGAGVGKLLVGFGQRVSVWVGAQFFTSMNFPFRGSAFNALLRANTDVAQQGRVFSAVTILFKLMFVAGVALAAPLADHVFEPAMQADGALVPLFGPLLGTGPGAGMSLLIVLVAPLMILAGVLALLLPVVRALNDATAPISPAPADADEPPPFPLAASISAAHNAEAQPQL
jgi:hypothetical protein